MTNLEIAARKEKLNDDILWYSNRDYDVRKTNSGYDLYSNAGFLIERHTIETSEFWKP
jgi:hypothetical protein